MTDDRARADRWLYPTHRSRLRRALGGLASRAWRVGSRLEGARHRPVDAGLPVISVGSLLVGGAGKTPVSIWLAEHLVERGVGRVLTVWRGFGGQSGAPRLVASVPPGPDRVGDEAAMALARWATRPELVGGVGRDRATVIARARLRWPDLAAVVLDDGLQHRRLARDLDIVVLPPRLDGLRVLPDGPLRAPLGRLPQRALLWCHDGGCAREPSGWPRPPALRTRCDARLETLDGAAVAPERVGTVALLSGIARNDRVRRTAEAMGLRVVAHLKRGDHAPLHRADFTSAAARATCVAITEKDAARCGRAWLAALPVEVLVLAIEISIDGHGRAAIDGALAAIPGLI